MINQLCIYISVDYLSVMKKFITGFILFLLAPACAAFVDVKEPSYEIVKNTEIYEIRQYPAMIAAETVVYEDFDDAGNVAHKRLFGYISGENRTNEKIPMTAPVTAEEKTGSKKIPMTAPVTMEEDSEGKFVYGFIMPEGSTMENLPEPLDPKVRLVKKPAKSVAVHRYTGTWSEETYREKVNMLKKALEADGLKPTERVVWSRYNPPFTLPFMRRNEIWIYLDN